MLTCRRSLAACAIVLGLAAPPARNAGAQQAADTTFDTRVARPAYPAGGGPRVLFDEAHDNFHTLGGSYRPFGELLTTMAMILKLADTAIDRPTMRVPERDSIRGAEAGQPGGALALRRRALEATASRSAAGRAQGIAFALGKGRVVVLGEAAMLSAQRITGPMARRLGRESITMGMNAPGNDDRQFALNIAHWLSGLLPATAGP
jgi:hypothetical protein